MIIHWNIISAIQTAAVTVWVLSENVPNKKEKRTDHYVAPWLPQELA